MQSEKPVLIGEEELFILNLLYHKRCLNTDRGFHEEKLTRLYRMKFGHGPDESVRKLLKTGFIARIGKSPCKYYISDMVETARFLAGAGYSVTKGREHRL